MKFRAIANPKPSEGCSKWDKNQVVPDQSLSLAEILRRFVRGEAVPVGLSTFGVDDGEQDHELDVDLEKLAHADLTEKDEWKEKARELQRKYERQEKAKADKAAKKAAEDREKAVQKRIDEQVAERLKRSEGGRPRGD